MKNRNNQLLYRRMGDGDGCQWNYATGLDEMRSTGSYLLQLRHGSAANGLPLPACTYDHYIEATLIVAESGTDDRLQKNRLIGQTLIMPQCSDGKTHIFTRTLNCAAGGSAWSSWDSVATMAELDARISGAKDVVWGASSCVDTFVTAGVYNINGQRLNVNDALPIANSNPGHTISARLVVLDSSIAGTGDEQDKCITQMLTLSNRTGGDGDVYIRTGRAHSIKMLAGGSGWEPWGKLQQNIEVGQVASLDTLTGNGIYSGVYTNGSSFFETFVMVVINNYAVAGATGNIRCISQFKYALNVDGTFSYKTRTGQGNTGISWGNWVDLGAADTTDIQDGAITAQKLSIALFEQINQNTANATKAANGAYWTSSPNAVTLNINKNDGTVGWQTLPAATTEKAGVMTASDREVVTSLGTMDYSDNPYQIGIWLEQDGKVAEGTSSSYARYNPIPVHSGQKIKVTAAAGTNNNALFITDKEGNIIYSKLASGTTMYVPEGAAMLYITSAIAAYSCVVYGVYDTNSYRAQKLDKLIGESITFPLNGYYTQTGAWQESSSWYCTEKIAVSENSGVETNATYIACWDINGKWLGRNVGKDGILEGTKYIAIYGQNDKCFLRFNSNNCNIPTQEDINILTRSVASLAEERTSVDVEMLNNVELIGNNVAVVEGVAGEVGAKYSVPITVKGGYGITMKFKMPDDLHTAVYERELISFGTRNHNTTNGFSVDIKSVLPTNDLSQVLCKSSLGFYPTDSKINDYAGRIDTVSITIKDLVGDAAFSIRYTGSLEGNEDIAYTLGENALRIYHTTTDVDVLNVPYPEDNLITSLLDAVNAHSGIVEAVGYCAENLSLDNIIKCSAIPLIGTYEGTTDAFPSFVLLKDDSWHTLEVRFDASKGKGVDMIAGYIDGLRFYHNNNGYKLYGDGFFKSELTFGCDGVAVKSIKVAPTLKSEIPNIVALCQHSINGDEKFNSTVTSSTNLFVTYGRTEELLRVFKKYGFKYVTSEQINGYLRRGEVLPHNSFTIIHDDYHYLRENAEKEYARDIRKLYLRNGIKAAFGLIPAHLTDEEIAEVEKDKDVFEFLIHDDYNLESKQGYQAIAARIANNISNFKSKLYTSNIWVYTGGVFDANTKMMLHAAGISMAYYTSGTNTSGGICDASDRLALPRLCCNDTGTTISKLEEILSNLVKH